jgi:hypothetical protein
MPNSLRLTFLGDVPLLVRELGNPQAGGGRDITTTDTPTARPRCAPHNWLPEMGSNHLDDHAGCSECHTLGSAFHLQAEAD